MFVWSAHQSVEKVNIYSFLWSKNKDKVVSAENVPLKTQTRLKQAKTAHFYKSWISSQHQKQLKIFYSLHFVNSKAVTETEAPFSVAMIIHLMLPFYFYNVYHIGKRSK